MRNHLSCVISLFLAAILCLTSCAQKTDPKADSSEAVGFFELGDDLYITKVFSYSGPYVENGANEECENVCAVHLFNNSKTAYQRLRFMLENEETSYYFSASTVLPDTEMTVLCEDAAAFSQAEYTGAKLLSAAQFDAPPSVHTESLLITYTDGFINVRNLTDAPINHLFIYYKNTDDFGLFGGITYRAAFDTLLPEETKQVRASHVRANSTVMFADYD